MQWRAFGRAETRGESALRAGRRRPVQGDDSPCGSHNPESVEPNKSVFKQLATTWETIENNFLERRQRGTNLFSLVRKVCPATGAPYMGRPSPGTLGCKRGQEIRGRLKARRAICSELSFNLFRVVFLSAGALAQASDKSEFVFRGLSGSGCQIRRVGDEWRGWKERMMKREDGGWWGDLYEKAGARGAVNRFCGGSGFCSLRNAGTGYEEGARHVRQTTAEEVTPCHRRKIKSGN